MAAGDTRPVVVILPVAVCRRVVVGDGVSRLAAHLLPVAVAVAAGAALLVAQLLLALRLAARLLLVAAAAGAALRLLEWAAVMVPLPAAVVMAPRLDSPWDSPWEWECPWAAWEWAEDASSLMATAASSSSRT